MTASMRRWRLVGSAMVLALSMMAWGNRVQAGAKVGEIAPDFTLTDAEGNQHSLAQYRGKIVVLEWTNPDCPFVQRHYAKGTMKTLAQKYAAKEVIWLAVNSTHYNKPEDSRTWSKEKALPYATLQDAEGTVGKLYGAQTSPHMYIIDKEGRLVYAGAIDDDARGNKANPLNYVAQALEEVLAGKPVSVAESKPYGCSVKYKKTETKTD